jgi:hypothetical protein
VFKGQDAVVSAIATASASLQKKLIDAAIKAGVQRFVPSEFGSDTRNEKAMAILVNCSRAMKVGFMGFDLKEQKATIYNEGNDVWSTTTMATIGLAVKNAMLVPEAANKYIFIDSFTVSQNEVLVSLEKATKKKWEAKYVDAEEQKRIGMEKMAEGDFSGAMLLIRYINCVEGHGENFSRYEKTFNGLLSLPKEDLDDVVVKIVKELEG